MWTILFDEANEENVRAIESVQRGLEAVREALSERSQDDIAALMRGTREWRREQ